jgi:hypothetical protein
LLAGREQQWEKWKKITFHHGSKKIKQLAANGIQRKGVQRKKSE